MCLLPEFHLNIYYFFLNFWLVSKKTNFRTKNSLLKQKIEIKQKLNLGKIYCIFEADLMLQKYTFSNCYSLLRSDVNTLVKSC